jgi:hypothetical protein
MLLFNNKNRNDLFYPVFDTDSDRQTLAKMYLTPSYDKTRF